MKTQANILRIVALILSSVALFEIVKHFDVIFEYVGVFAYLIFVLNIVVGVYFGMNREKEVETLF